MIQSLRPSLPLGLAVALALTAGCGPQALHPPTKATTSAAPVLATKLPSAAPLLANQGTLTGTVIGPGDGVISNNGGSLISQTKFFRVADTGGITEPVAGAKVAAYDLAGAPLCTAVETDASGRYELKGIGPSGPVIVVRASYSRLGHELTLARVAAAPRQEAAPVQLDPSSTLVSKKLDALLASGTIQADVIDPAAAAQLAEALAPAIDGKVAVSAALGSPVQAARAFDALVEDDPRTSQLASSVTGAQNSVPSPTPSPTPMPSASPTAAPTSMPTSTPTAGPSSAPAPVLSTLAGNGTVGLVDGPAASAEFRHPSAVVSDAAGNVYVGDQANHAIRKIAPDGTVSTLVSDPNFTPWNLVMGPDGVLVVADTNQDVIRKVTLAGQMSVYAGAIGVAGSTDGPVASARFNLPEGMVFDASGNLYVTDIGGQRIRRIDTAGKVSTIAGGTKGYANGTGTAAQFYCPRALCLDAGGNLILADRYNHRLRRVTPAGVVTTLAGSGQIGKADGPALQASFNEPQAVLIGPGGEILISDSKNNCIRVLSPAGVVSTLGGTDAGGLANPLGTAIDGAGRLLIADSDNNRIRILAPGRF